jgi:hypothetical protein
MRSTMFQFPTKIPVPGAFRLITSILLLLLHSLFAIAAQAQSGSTLTWDFEDGAVGDWKSSGQVQVVIDQIDPLTDNAMHTVAQGQYTLMVGDSTAWAEAGSQFSSIERIIEVPQIPDPVLQFSYAVVANDPPDHTEIDKPYFALEVRDQVTQELLPVSDAKYTSQTSQDWFLGTPPANQSLSRSSFNQLSGDRWVFIPWKHQKLDLAKRQGHQILVKFTVRDCNPQAHAAYGYIDNIVVGADEPLPALPALIKQPLPAGVPQNPGLLAPAMNFVEQYALWPWCLLLPLLLLGLLAYRLLRRRVTVDGGDHNPPPPSRPPPRERRESRPPANTGQGASWRGPDDRPKR